MGRTIICVLAIILVLCQNALAIPSEGNFLPGLHKTIWGFQFNSIFRRDFNKVEGKASSTQYFLKASYGLTSRFFLDGKVGFGNVSFKRNDGLDLDFLTGFAGGYGFRYIVWEDQKNGLKSIFGFQHISCHPFKDTVGSEKHRIIWDEWQGTWLFIKEYSKADIYLGPQYSSAQLKYKIDDLRRRLKAENSWGMLMGTNYKINEDININAEVRLFDEWAVNFGISHKF
jgi:hypothetical protein